MNAGLSAADHVLAGLSQRALRYGARLRPLSSGQIAARLYRFHALPLTQAWRMRLASPAGIGDWLGLAGSEDWARRLADAYVGMPDPSGHWLHWRRPGTGGPLRHKLYVSPTPDALSALFARLVPICCELDAPAFKVGSTAQGVLRPDKLVVYFASQEHLTAVAGEAATALGRFPVHGVPFTAPADRSGLLSWGHDPAGAGSWRVWLCRLLADAISGAPADDLDGVVAHAQGRLAAAGVDPRRWTPLQ